MVDSIYRGVVGICDAVIVVLVTTSAATVIEVGVASSRSVDLEII